MKTHETGIGYKTKERGPDVDSPCQKELEQVMNEYKKQYSHLPNVIKRSLKQMTKWVIQPKNQYNTHQGKRLLSGNPRFDERKYLFFNRDLIHSNMNLCEHVLLYGWKENRRMNNDETISQLFAPENTGVNTHSLISLLKQEHEVYQTIANSAYFDREFYRNAYLGIENSQVDEVEHYIRIGWKEGRNPGPFFHTTGYLNEHDDVKESGMNPLFHYLKYGLEEGRSINHGEKAVDPDVYRTIQHSELFDYKYYIDHNPDLLNLNTDFVQHYIEYGWKEGRDPSALFDTQYYLESNLDVKSNGINPLFHYIKHGQFEGRFPREDYQSSTNVLSRMKFHYQRLKYIAESKNINSKKIKEYVKTYGLKHTVRNALVILGGKSNTELNIIYRYVQPKLDRSIKSVIKHFSYKPKISVIIPVYNVDPKWLQLAIESVEKQWYTNWEICIVDDCSTNEDIQSYLKSLHHEKIKVKFLKENLNISGASNEALKLATGDYILLLDNDDEITHDAMYEVVKLINEKGAEFIYSDEDKLDMNGSCKNPHYKPDYSPAQILSQNYITHLAVIKKTLVDEVDGFTIGLEGAQDHDLFLKVLERTNKVVHIPKILYHWREIPGSTAFEFSEKSYAQEVGRQSVENALLRRKIAGKVTNGPYPGTFNVRYDIIGNPLVSIIIPFKDKPELLKMCVESIIDQTDYQNYEIIGVSNNSEEQETFDEMKRLLQLDDRVRFIEYDVPFNYSKINNYAVNNYTNGEHILLLNNDIEIIHADWLTALLEQSQQEDVGAVGAKLLYPNDTLQHAGVIAGLGGVAGHSHKHFPKDHPGYFCRPHIVQNLSAVTAACMMVKKEIYDRLKGLDEEHLTVAFNDVDFCFRIQELGYLNVYTPYAEAYHHESISRGYEDSPEKVKRFESEIKYILKRHEKLIGKGDPFYNPNLTLDREDFSFK